MSEGQAGEEQDVAALKNTIAELRQMVGELKAALQVAKWCSGRGNNYLIARPVDHSRDNLLRRPRPPLPDPRMIDKLQRARALRSLYFEADLFADPAWDIMLDLCAARAQHRMVSVTSLCIAAQVPATTALRWIQMMTERGLLTRTVDPMDKRRTFVGLADDVAASLASYFDELNGTVVI